MSKVTYDVIGLREAATNALTAIVRGSFTLIGALVTMFVFPGSSRSSSSPLGRSWRG